MSDETEESHPVWKHVVKAGKNTADMTVDVAAIAGISYMAVNGVPPATLQVVGAMVVTIALGKRYYDAKEFRA